MPTTLTGLLLFVVLLLPGFAYLVGKERAGTERRTSPFRETVAIVAASVTTEIVVLTLASPAWSRSLDADRLMSSPGAYLREDPRLVAGWGLGLLALATLLAYAATLRWVRLMPRWLRLRIDYPHPSTVSAWWTLFETHPAELERQHKQKVLVRVACYLSDGSLVEGTAANFNQLADDTPDRDLILASPIERTDPNGAKITPKSQVACLSARDIRTMLVHYRSAPAPASESSDGPAPESDGST